MLKEQLEKLHQETLKNSSDNKDFLRGQLFSFYSSLELIKSQAVSFSIPLSEIDLDNYDLEQFLY